MRRRRAVLIFIVGTIVLVLLGGAMPQLIEESLPKNPEIIKAPSTSPKDTTTNNQPPSPASAELEALLVKGRAPKTNYTRDEFGNGWGKTNGCDTRNIILYRDLQNPVLEGECKVASGKLLDPYTAEEIYFTNTDSDVVQIDHVVALSNAWQTGAQQLSIDTRKKLANDPLELLAVDGQANQQKSDSDAASWLPKNKAFRCEYVARQIAIKKKYTLWVTESEKQAMKDVLLSCPSQVLP